MRAVLRRLKSISVSCALLVAAGPACAYDPFANYRESARVTFDKQNQITLAVGAASFGLARGWDERAREAYRHQRRLGSSEDFFNEVLGTGVPGAVLGAGFWVYGAKRESTYEVHAGQATLEALLATGVLTAALKGLVGRERPDGGDRHSFPSGHTSTVSASAMTLAEFYGWKAAVPGFALVALTGLSRVAQDRHWLSDTVGGAVLGIWVAHSVSRAHLDQVEGQTAPRALEIIPLVEPGGARIVLVYHPELAGP